MQLHTYLNYGGNCEEAFKFYEKHLGGKITMMMRHGESPDRQQVLPGWESAVLHARMNLGGTELLGADIPPDRFQPHSQCLPVAHAWQRPGGRSRVCAAFRRRTDLHADAGYVFCLSLCDAPG